jgi:thymidylate synthase (FAD)
VEKGWTRQVLDEGYVKLVDWMGREESIIEAARMSTDGGFVSWAPYENHPKGDHGLLTYLWREGHHTPFEMCELLLEVEAPIFVFREWMRHRTFSYNELSARYTQMPNKHYVPAQDRMVRQGVKNKQGSSTEALGSDTAHVLQDCFRKEQQAIYEMYEDALNEGLVREVARINTPVSRYSRMRVKGNLRNWLNFLRLRQAPNAQYEIREYANVIGSIVDSIWPRTYALFEEWDRYGVKLNRAQYDEYQALKQAAADEAERAAEKRG